MTSAVHQSSDPAPVITYEEWMKGLDDAFGWLKKAPLPTIRELPSGAFTLKTLMEKYKAGKAWAYETIRQNVDKGVIEQVAWLKTAGKSMPVYRAKSK